MKLLDTLKNEPVVTLFSFGVEGSSRQRYSIT